MGNVVGIASILVWVVVIVPLIWQFFPEAGGWDWKRTLVAALGAPFFYGFGRSICESITKQPQKNDNTPPVDNDNLPSNNERTSDESNDVGG